MTAIELGGIDMKEGEGIRDAVDVVVFNGDGEVLLGKRLVKAGEGEWGFPGGHLRTGERIIHCARRELREELGSKARIRIANQIISVRENSIPPLYIHHLTVIIKGSYLGGDIAVNEPESCSEWGWFRLDNLPQPLFPE